MEVVAIIAGVCGTDVEVGGRVVSAALDVQEAMKIVNRKDTRMRA